MKSRSPLETVTGVVGDAAAGLRRRREARRPYAKLYDAAGDVVVLESEDERAQGLLDTATAMVDAAAPPSRAGRSESA